MRYKNEKIAKYIAAPIITLAILTMSFGNLIPLKQIQGGIAAGQVIQMQGGISVWDSLDYNYLRNRPAAATNMATANQTQSGNRTHAGGGFSWIHNGVGQYTIGATSFALNVSANSNIAVTGNINEAAAEFNFAQSGGNSRFGMAGDEFYINTMNNLFRTSFYTTQTANRSIGTPNLDGIIALIEQFSGGTTNQVLTRTGPGVGQWSWQTPTGAALGTNTTVAVTIAGGNISGSTVTIPAGQTPNAALPRLLYINGIKAPGAAYTITGTNFVVNNTNMPFSIAVGDYAEMVFNY